MKPGRVSHRSALSVPGIVSVCIEARAPASARAGADCGRIGALDVGCEPPARAASGIDAAIASESGEAQPATGASSATGTLSAPLAGTPNPFRGSTTLTYELRAETPVSLTIHDLAGRVVRRLRDGTFEGRGVHRIAWPGTDDAGRALDPGIYFVTIATRDRVDRLRLMHLD